MTTWYVSNVGNDSNPGSELSPFLTVEHAMSQAFNGDVINLMDIISTSVTIVISKQLNFIGIGGISKSTAGDVISIQNNNVSIRFLTLTANATNTADAIITIDRGSAGLTPPNNYNNIQITNNTFYLYKYGIFVNGTNVEISDNAFLRSGGTERLSDIIVYQSNGLTINNNTVTDTLRTQRFVYLTSSGTGGTTYFDDCNAKSGLMTISNNICNCSSTAQSFILMLQDAFIGSGLSFDVFGNDLNLAIAGKVFVSYVGADTDLATITAADVHNNNIDISSSGIVHIDSPVSVTLPTALKFYVYGNVQQSFTLDPARSGNSDFTQTTSTVLPADLYLSTIVQYSGNVTEVTVSNGGNIVVATSTDTGLAVTIDAIVEVGEKYVLNTEFAGSMLDVSITSTSNVDLVLTIPSANTSHALKIYKKNITIQPSGYPVVLTYGSNWVGSVPSTSSISVIDTNAFGSAI